MTAMFQYYKQLLSEFDFKCLRDKVKPIEIPLVSEVNGWV